MPDRVLLLASGGLDGHVAADRLVRAGLEVHAVHFDTGFVPPARRRNLDAPAWRGLGLATTTIEPATDLYAELLRGDPGPRGGAPCRTCRVGMLRRAAARADRLGIRRLATGDVAGQRREDQTRERLAEIDRLAGVDGRVWRPLAPAAGAPGLPGGAGPRIQGTSRRVQVGWAAAFVPAERPVPHVGCCRLATPSVERRARDLFRHTRNPSAAELATLHVGRAYRLGWDARVVVTRTAADAEALRALHPDGLRASVAAAPGAEAWLFGADTPDLLDDAAALLLAVRGAPVGRTARVRFSDGARVRETRARPADPECVALWRV